MLERLQTRDASESERQAQRDQVEEFIQRIIERLMESGYISMAGKPDAQKLDGPGGSGEHVTRAEFEVTDKALDFLGYRALRDLLGSIGRSSTGRHDTRELDTGIDASGAPRPYAFGDTLNLDATATVLNAVARRGRSLSAVASAKAESPGSLAPGEPVIDLDYEDLMVAQATTRVRARPFCSSIAATAWCSTARIASRRPSAWRWPSRT
jgi:hypothetical protein